LRILCFWLFSNHQNWNL